MRARQFLLPAVVVFVSRLLLAEDDAVRWSDLELGIFFHLGLNTFQDVERAGGALDPSAFDPRELDADQWVEAAREAGARYVVITARHRDGFCLWPTRTASYSVRSSPWKKGEGDVVRELAEACSRRGLKLGVSFSLGGRRDGDGLPFRQLEELLTGYGPLVEVRLDGGGLEGESQDLDRAAARARMLQPEAMVFVGGKDPPRAPKLESIREGWFFKPDGERTLKPLEELLVIYYRSVGRGANLLLGVAPDRRGLVPDADRARLRELGTETRRRFGKALASVRGAGGELELDPGGAVVVDHVLLAEDPAHGDCIRRYAVEGLENGAWKEVCRGTAAGRKRIHSFEPLRVDKLRLRVLEAAGTPLLGELSAFAVGGPSLASSRLRRGRLEEERDRLEEALRELDLALDLDELLLPACHFRANVLFKLGRFAEALRDYDRAAAGGAPHDESACWERGLARYYLGDFDGGRKQFEGYHSVDSLDIENGLWRFLCMAEREGLVKARQALLPYSRRVRRPFPALLQLYSGSGSPEGVLAEATAGLDDGAARNENLFYAHYYLAKHFEVHRERQKAIEHLKEALGHRIPHFMYHCARIDLGRLIR